MDSMDKCQKEESKVLFEFIQSLHYCCAVSPSQIGANGTQSWRSQSDVQVSSSCKMAISPRIFSSTGFSRDKTVLVLQLHVDAGVLCKVPKNLSCSDQKRHAVSMRFWKWWTVWNGKMTPCERWSHPQSIQ